MPEDVIEVKIFLIGGAVSPYSDVAEVNFRTKIDCHNFSKF